MTPKNIGFITLETQFAYDIYIKIVLESIHNVQSYSKTLQCEDLFLPVLFLFRLLGSIYKINITEKILSQVSLQIF